MLRSGDRATRRGAVSSLLERSPAAEAAVPALIEALDDTDPGVRNLVVRTLTQIGLEIVPAVAKALKDARANVRAGALDVLATLAPAGKALVPELIRALDDKDASVRKSSAEVLGALAKDGDLAETNLIKAVKDTNRGVRAAAIVALGEIRTGSTAACDALIQQLKTEDHYLGKLAASSLSKMCASDESLSALIQILRDTTSETARDNAITAVGLLGPKAKRAIPLLLKCLSPGVAPALNKENNSRARAAWALGEAGPYAIIAVAALIDALRDKSVDANTREAAIESLIKIAPGAEGVLSALRE